MYDLIIKNGKIIDGTGSPSFFADVAVTDGKIVKIAKKITDEGIKTIDAKGLTVTPGFVDSHSHSDTKIFTFPDMIEKIEQGITTAVGGQCGLSISPVSIDHKEYDVPGFGKSSVVYKTMGTFLENAKKLSLGSNQTLFVGHRALRNAAMGAENRDPSAYELQKMGELLEEGIKGGALGVSFGLIYPPSSYAKTEELIYLAKVAAECGGMASAHIRDEGYNFIAATEEFATVIRESGIRGVFSHHKAMYKDNHGKVHTTLRIIDKLNDDGFDAYLDTYPYTASCTSLSARFIPGEYLSGGPAALSERLRDESIREEIKKINYKKFGSDDLSWVLVSSCDAYPQYEGLRLNEIAKKHGKDIYDTVFDMVMESENVCEACYFLMCDEDLKTVMAHPRCMICTDAGVRGDSDVYHPRLRGTFPRVLGRYVREKKTVSLPEMIRKITSMPASVYGLVNKGIIREGFDADICIFDEERIIDRSDYTSCHERAEGLSYVLLGGEIAVENAIYTETKAGKILIRK